MTWKKLLVIALAVLAFGFASAPRSEAGLSIGIGLGVPVAYGYPYGYGPAYYPYTPYGYYQPVVGVYVRPRYHWYHHRRVYYPVARRGWR
jgi:hypothetical protein